MRLTPLSEEGRIITVSSQPEDAVQLARYIRAALRAATRSVDWFHLPVPIERDAERRIAAARIVVGVFGVGTGCGIGRAPADSVDGILATHTAVAGAYRTHGT